MSQDITLAQFRRWLSLFAEQVQEQVDLLTELDAAIGDADHGANMQRGMRKVQERLQDPAATGDDIGSLFRSIAMTLIALWAEQQARSSAPFLACGQRRRRNRRSRSSNLPPCSAAGWKASNNAAGADRRRP